MNRLHRLFITVAGISFVGSLPPGILNTSVSGLVASAGPAVAGWFGLGAILAEMTIVRVAHAGMEVWPQKLKIPRWLGITLSVLLISLMLFHSGKTSGTLRSLHYPFLAGVLFSVLNPLHLPFWLGWTAVLRSKNILVHARVEYHLFSAAIGVGTALAFLVYGLAGHLILNWWVKG
jgi:threonine/homoserine/homoserine lactone efflux protein